MDTTIIINDTIRIVDTTESLNSTNYNDTLTIINKVIIENIPMDKFWDRIFPLLGIILTLVTLIIVWYNLWIGRNYGGFNERKDYIRLKKKLNNYKNEYNELKSILEPIINLNPFDFFKKVKEEDTFMFKYEDQKLKDIVTKMFKKLSEEKKNFFQGAYSNLMKTNKHLVTQKTGQNNKYNDGREYYFIMEVQSIIDHANNLITRLATKIDGIKDAMKNIKIR